MSCFNMWVTSGSYVGHIRIVLWVSGSNESTRVTHFQPGCLVLSAAATYKQAMCIKTDVVSREAKKKQHVCASSGPRDHYSELFTWMAALKF